MFSYIIFLFIKFYIPQKYGSTLVVLDPQSSRAHDSNSLAQGSYKPGINAFRDDQF